MPLLYHTFFKGRVGTLAYPFFIWQFLILFNAPLLGQNQPSDPPKHLIASYNQVLYLKSFNKESWPPAVADNPHPFYYYVVTLKSSIDLLTHNRVSQYHQYLEKVNHRIHQLEQYEDTNPYKKFCIAEIKLQSAFIRLKFGDRLSAAWQLKSAYALVQENQQAFPDFKPNYRSAGLLAILIGMVPDQYHWILSLMGMEGGIQKGFNALDNLQNSLFHQEALLLKAMTKVYYTGSQKEAIEELTNYCQNKPDNLLANYLLALILVKSNASQQALGILNSKDYQNAHYIRWPYLAYLSGEIFLQKGRYKKAINNYQAFINHHPGEHLLKDAHFKIFWGYWLQNKVNPAGYYRKQARQQGTTFAAADKYAHNALKNEDYPHKSLLKIRLATDGGFYGKADSLLATIDAGQFTQPKDQVEYKYRKARYYHKTGDTLKAQTFYKKTIEQQTPQQPLYFAPNACLQLGFIFKNKGNDSQAITYLDQIENYQDYPYRKSITQKSEVLRQALKP